MGNAEIEKILEHIEKLLIINEEKCYEVEKKMYANEKMAIEDRVRYTIDFCQYNAVCITLRGIVALIKGSFETEKFLEEKRQEQKISIKDTFRAQHNWNEKDAMRKQFLIQLQSLIKDEQASAITTLETSLGDRGIENKEIYQIYKYRLEGVIHVINETGYIPETSYKIAQIINKLYENNIL